MDKGSTDRYTVCKDCAGEIPVNARRCRHCSSYQDYRRWVGNGNALLALAVSMVALIASLWSPTQSFISSLRPLALPDYSVSIANIDSKQVITLLTNSGEVSSVATGGTCRLWLPAEPTYFFDGDKYSSGPSRWPIASEVIGMTTIYLESPEPILLDPGESTDAVFSVESIEPVRELLGSVDSEKEMLSYCSIILRGSSGQRGVAFTLLEPIDLVSFNLRRLVTEWDYAPFQKPVRDVALMKLKSSQKEP